jgi:hypothetical protein
MGLIVDVYRNAASKYDCTNGGATGRARELTLVNVEGPFEPTEDRPAALLLAGAMPGIVRIVMAEPALPDEDGAFDGWRPLRAAGLCGPMMGGNYAATSDSRFSEAIEKTIGHRFYGAVQVHDRYETSELNRQLSN